MILQRMYSFFDFPTNQTAFSINKLLFIPVKVVIFLLSVFCNFFLFTIRILTELLRSSDDGLKSHLHSPKYAASQVLLPTSETIGFFFCGHSNFRFARWFTRSALIIDYNYLESSGYTLQFFTSTLYKNIHSFCDLFLLNISDLYLLLLYPRFTNALFKRVFYICPIKGGGNNTFLRQNQFNLLV